METQATEAVSVHSRDWLSEGISLARLKNWNGAIESYENALTEDENDEVAWYKKGVALTMLKRFDDAIDCFDRALAINPGNPETWFNKGSALANGFGNYREAIDCYREAKNLGDKDADQAITLCQRKMSGPKRGKR
jgi:tetratricopeptide (TPR) repeat protein